MNDLRQKMAVFEIGAQNFFVEPIDLALDVFERAKIGYDVQIEQRGDETFGVELADLSFADFVLAEFFKIRNFAVVNRDDEISADDKINRQLHVEVVFGRFDGDDKKTVKIFKNVDRRSLGNIENGFDRHILQTEPGNDFFNRFSIAVQNVDPDELFIVNRFQINVFELYLLVVSLGVIEINRAFQSVVISSIDEFIPLKL